MNRIFKLAYLLGIIAFGILPTLVLAQDSSSGCGVGWMVTQRQSLISSWVRQSTNVTFSNTIAMTSGTSGCAKHDIVLNEKKAEHFAEANFDRLRLEMSGGRGEFLTAFSEILGCDAGASATFAELVQANYAELFAGTPSSDELLARTRALVSLNPGLAFRCQNARLIARN